MGEGQAVGMSGMAVRVCSGDDDEWLEPMPNRLYAGLLGGPLDGQLLDVTDWTPEERAQGALLVTDRGLFGARGRAYYSLAATDPDGPFLWDGDTP